MQWFKNRSRATRIAAVLVLALGLAAPVVADTVYTWTTEEGTKAFTDDVKHIPSRYRGQVEVKVLEPLSEYHKYTPSASVKAEQVEAAAAHAAVPGVITVPQTGVATVVGGSRYGRGAMVVPVEPNGSEEPVIVEERRVKPDDSMATRHETVVRQGDRVISIQRDELNHRDGSNMVPPVDD